MSDNTLLILAVSVTTEVIHCALAVLFPEPELLYCLHAEVHFGRPHLTCVGTGQEGSEQEPELVFLYKLQQGSAPQSYGLQVLAAKFYVLQACSRDNSSCCASR